MRPELKYGLIAGLGMSGWLFAEFLLGLHTTRLEIGTYTTWGTEIILVVALWFFLRRKLANLKLYWLPLWKGLLYGTLTSFVAGLVLYIYYSYYLGFLNPEWPDLYINWQVAHMRAHHASEESVLSFAKTFRWSVTAPGLVFNIIGLYTVLGTLASSILTLWLNWRHKEPVQAS